VNRVSNAPFNSDAAIRSPLSTDIPIGIILFPEATAPTSIGVSVKALNISGESQIMDKPSDILTPPLNKT
jgi:hypothetical protein